jgi:hypothetical protein
MKTSIRLVKANGVVTIEIIDLKYKNKVVASYTCKKEDVKWLVPQLLDLFRI